MKGKTVIIVILVLVGLCVLCFGSIYLAWNLWLKNANIPGINTIVTSEGTETTVSTDDGDVTYRETKTWPSDMPGIVPKFSKGTITSTARLKINQTSWTVLFANVEKPDMQAYVSELEASGWEVNSMDFDEIVTNSAQKDNYTIVVTYESSKKEMSIIVTEEAQD